MYAQLSPLLKEYQIILEDYLPLKGTRFDDIPQYQCVFLDLATIHRKLIKSLCLLTSVDDSEMDISIYAICRSLTANALTTYYFLGFCNEKGEIDNETICNELQALNCEFVYSKKDVEKLQGIYTDIITEDEAVCFCGNKYKSHMDFHTDSNPIAKANLHISNMLTEKQKMTFAALKAKSDSQKNNIHSTFILNKIFTQYYHYSCIGGEYSRTSQINRTKDVNAAIICAIDALVQSLTYVEVVDNYGQFKINCFKIGKQLQILREEEMIGSN